MEEIIQSGTLSDLFKLIKPFPISFHDHRSKLSEGGFLDLKGLLVVWSN